MKEYTRNKNDFFMTFKLKIFLSKVFMSILALIINKSSYRFNDLHAFSNVFHNLMYDCFTHNIAVQWVVTQQVART